MLNPFTDRVARPNVLTVNLEDYFQVGAFNQYVQSNKWGRFECRVELNVAKTLDLLDRHGAKATFFTLGWIAEHYPHVIAAVAERGHEVASRGYYHRTVANLTPEEFRKDLDRAKRSIERITRRRVLGYRMADGWLKPTDHWVLDVLAEAGYAYDSSICPFGTTYLREPARRFPHPVHIDNRTLWEVPLSSSRFLGFDVPVAGGNWLRQMPHALMKRLIGRWVDSHESPLVMYFHTWELDPDQPRLATAGYFTRKRQYRNLEKMEARLGEYLTRYRFVGVADYLKIPNAPADDVVSITETPPPSRGITDSQLPPLEPGTSNATGVRTPVTIVVPLYNEELLVPYMAKTLEQLAKHLQKRYAVKFSLVDDGSTDRTWDMLVSGFARRPDVELHRHPVNLGVSAAILTGLRAAETEIVCSMDADCSYDPLELARMIPKLEPGVHLVTASPYHPEGQVRNVPGWRLVLSRGASWMYRRVMRNKLSTYTSCFRVYRKSAVQALPIVSGNFLGIAELLGRLDLVGGKIVEHPTTLDVRIMGRSKMKTARTVAGHLKLMARLLGARAREWWSPSPPLEHRNDTIKSLIAAASKRDTRYQRNDRADQATPVGR
jgi:polysaccharide deacetylase family protein (PEP-CTERM system associated)